MINRMQTAAARLSTRLKSRAGETVTYHRGADSVSLTAVVGETDFESVEESDRLVRMESRDFLFDAADLVLDEVETRPERGDQIKQTIDGTVHVFDLYAPDGTDIWRWSDRANKQIRAHANFAGTE